MLLYFTIRYHDVAWWYMILHCAIQLQYIRRLLRRVRAIHNTDNNQPCILQIESRGEFEGGNPYPRLTPTQRAPMAAEGARGGPIGSGHWSCFWRTPHTNHYFSLFNTHPQAVDGRRRPSDTGPVLFANQWKYMKIIENHWKSLKTIEHLWKSLKINENQWKSIDHHWTSMTIIEINENPWISMEIYEH